jgi:hypothetical protein
MVSLWFPLGRFFLGDRMGWAGLQLRPNMSQHTAPAWRVALDTPATSRAMRCHPGVVPLLPMHPASQASLWLAIRSEIWGFQAESEAI